MGDGSPGDAVTFVGRDDEMQHLLSGLEHAFNTVLTGEAGMGRTSPCALIYEARTEGQRGPVSDCAPSTT
jgi:hypothetical protein